MGELKRRQAPHRPFDMGREQPQRGATPVQRRCPAPPMPARPAARSSPGECYNRPRESVGRRKMATPAGSARVEGEGTEDVGVRSGTGAANGLVVRFAPEAGESLRGYLLRLAEANGYPYPSWLAEAIWGDRHVGLLGPRTAAILAAKAGAGAGDGDLLGSATTRKGLVLFGPGVALPQRLFDLSRPKVCPACMVEREVLFAAWDLAFWRVCPTHGCDMLNVCPACRLPLRWGRSRVGRCCDGMPFDSQRTLAASDAAIDLARAFARAAGFPAPSPSAALQGLAGNLGLAALHELVACLGTLGAPAGAAQSTSRRLDHEALFRRSAAALSDWPRGLHEAIDASRDADAGRGTTSFQLEFPALYRALAKRRLAGNEFAFVRRAAVAHVETRHPWLLLRCGPPAPAGGAGSLVPLKEAARVFGLGRRVIVAHARRGAFRALSRPIGAHTRWYVDLDGLGAFIRERGLAQSPRHRSRPADRRINMTREQAARTLGVGRNAIERLRTSGALGASVAGANGHPTVHEDAVEALLAKFEALLSPKQGTGMAPGGGPPAGGPLRPVTLMTFASCRTGPLPDVVDLVLRGGLRPAVVDASAKGLARYLFAPSDLRDLLDRERRRGASTMATALRALRCSRPSFRMLIKEGHLEAVRAPTGAGGGRRSVWVSTASLAGFTSRYVTLGNICSDSGEHFRAVVARLRRAGVEPVPVGAGGPVFYSLRDMHRGAPEHAASRKGARGADPASAGPRAPAPRPSGARRPGEASRQA